MSSNTLAFPINNIAIHTVQEKDCLQTFPSRENDGFVGWSKVRTPENHEVLKLHYHCSKMISNDDLLTLSKFPSRGRLILMQLVNEGSTQEIQAKALLTSNLSCNWKDFIEALLEREPSISASGDLEFVCRFQLLSDHLQTQILTMIHSQQRVIPKTCIDTLISSIEIFAKTKPWLNLLSNSLKSEWVDELSINSVSPHVKNPFNPWTLPIPRGSLHMQQEPLRDERLLCSQNSFDSPVLSQWDATVLSSQLSQNSAVLSSQHSSENIDLSLLAEQLREAWFSSNETCLLVNILTQHSLEQVEELCSLVDLGSLPEQRLGDACRQLEKLSNQLPHGVILICAKHLLLSKVSQLDQLASRTLSSCTLSFAETFPPAFVESVLIPVALSATLTSHQVDLILKVLKQSLQGTHKTQLLEKFLERFDASDTLGLLIPVFQHLLDCQCPMRSSTMSSFLSMLQKMSESCLKIVPFGKLLLNLIKKYGTQLNSSNKMQLQLIANNHQTFMKKSALSALNKL
ncbi:hypothetical protein CAPTEDRAFT_197935 [Capitella teleta]|uniref:Fanconi Anaemia group E protein C-terminal domain-containing protein n=1 Tax=Capitella teleta TaxID=283909 RepID=R7U606_CAPTE|nr:hypothetical protein CAPTEDRAFT_197935 [Capitella teleta]|eukprot:ELU01516.1 hypothetical protein CAPTEDRAFT_197935 [Capitella teleta]